MFKSTVIQGLIAIILFSSCSSAPKGSKKDDAEVLAQRMLSAAKLDLWKNNTSAISFEFAGKHVHFWDKKRGLIEVQWSSWFKDIKVQFMKANHFGIVYIDNKRITDKEDIKDYIADAYSYFINDSFWVNPIYHIYSPGTTRLLFQNKLLVKYNSGGVTPGDVYLFDYDKKNRIKSMKMWVSIIPIKGIEATFEKYQNYDTGIEIATRHKLSFLNIELTKIKTFRTYPNEKDRFKDLLKAKEKFLQ